MIIVPFSVWAFCGLGLCPRDYRCLDTVGKEKIECETTAKPGVLENKPAGGSILCEHLLENYQGASALPYRLYRTPGGRKGLGGCELMLNCQGRGGSAQEEWGDFRLLAGFFRRWGVQKWRQGMAG